jgi:hypothetical protein
MRYLKTLTLNRRAIYDDRVALTTNSDFTLATSNSVILPNSSTSITSPVTGQMRYNSSTNEVEIYQGSSAKWRAIRYKESTTIVQQSLGNIDGYSYFYGALNAAYNPSNVASGTTLGGQNIFVFIENVPQIFNTNYVITQNPTAGVNLSAQANNGDTTLTLTSTATIPTGSVVSGSSYIQAGTVATVTGANTVSLSLPISGGNIPNGAPITFTAPAGYYVNFTSDPNYASMIGKPITVLIGFDQ